ncbi:PIG-L family deacetylase [Thermobifida halotolerans]|uniref:PIG-L family deacetylase n=1 Tax=Thermobifida halotolerans TaxID=483545 RepID=A0A399G201_9ACTN|nr:PIG-L family deacetylase [Thermobifida halotolerans]UOE20025.1 PIG-L family deacetylase [Thermobifida halotolerans]
MRATRWAERRRHPMDRPGTSEASWRGWPALREFPAVHLAGITSAVAVAPHPGDEILAVGGAISMLAASGARLRVVSVSDEGEFGPGTRGASWERLAEVRHALRVLGADDAEVIPLGLSSGLIRDGAAGLEQTLARLCAGFDLCLGPWEGDRHPDHEAVADAARAASATLGVPMLGCPVWMWHWARPEDTRVPWERVNRIVLPEETRRRKVDAIACLNVWNGANHVTADGTTLSTEKVAHFIRDAELVFR